MSDKQAPYYDKNSLDNARVLIEDLKDSLFGKCTVVKPDDAAMEAAQKYQNGGNDERKRN